MKALIIIASIILLSYQIDRFFTKDKAIAPVEVQKNTVSEFQEKATATENAVLSSLEVTANENAETFEPKVEGPLAEEEPAIVAMVTETAGITADKSAEMKVTHAVASDANTVKASSKFRLKQVSKINQHAKIFHSRIKESGNYMALNTVQFEHNKFDVLGSDEFSTVMHYADLLVFDRDLKVSVAGFSDNTGDAGYNEQLSLMRAVHVQNYLVDLGVKEEQILVSAYGIESPVADNKTKEGRALNRRVELAIISNAN